MWLAPVTNEDDERHQGYEHGGMGELREAGKEDGQLPAVAAPAAHRQHEHRCRPQERQLAEQQRLGERGIDENGNGPPAPA